MKSNVVIGIISWLPDDEEVRKIRLERLKTLVNTCDSIFNRPIMIVAQNYRDEDLGSENVTLLKYDKLGITKARETLRQEFLKTDYTNIICFDDDFELNGSDTKIGQTFLSFIDEHNDKLIEHENYLMNLLVIPRDIFEKEPFDESISAENGTGYEDWIYVTVLKRKYSKKYLNIKTKLPLKSRHDLTLDTYSTWKNGEQKDQTDISKKLIIRKLLGR